MELGEWHVVWVPFPGGWGPLPEGALGVRDLPGAVAGLGLQAGDPVFLAPDFTVDLDLLDFVRSNAFRWLERETKRNYATDVRLLLDFLWSRDVPWREASVRDLADYRAWRCPGAGESRRISGGKWNREAAAFTKLFRWARVSPLPVDVSRREDRAAHAVSSRVSLLTPRTWGLWSNVGLRGQTRAGAAALGWASRAELRNTSFVQLLLSSGLRRQEGASLLTFEVPTQRLRSGRDLHGRVAGAVTRSKRDRTFYAGVDAVGQISRVESSASGDHLSRRMPGVTVYDIAAQLPSVDVLRQRCKALAVLDAIIGGDYYTYDCAWGADEAASMRNGSGEEFDIVFTADGVFIRGVYHESPMFGYTGGRLWPGLLDGLPKEFQSQVTEPAFCHPDGTLNASFVLWRGAGDKQWHAGNDIDFSPANDDEVDPDGSWLLDILFEDGAEKYCEHAEEVSEVGLPLSVVRHVTAFLPLTEAVIRALNPHCDPVRVRAEAEKLGYPVAAVADHGAPLG